LRGSLRGREGRGTGREGEEGKVEVWKKEEGGEEQVEGRKGREGNGKGRRARRGRGKAGGRGGIVVLGGGGIEPLNSPPINDKRSHFILFNMAL